VDSEALGLKEVSLSSLWCFVGLDMYIVLCHAVLGQDPSLLSSGFMGTDTLSKGANITFSGIADSELLGSKEVPLTSL
jgi:hypothetical protein